MGYSPIDHPGRQSETVSPTEAHTMMLKIDYICNTRVVNYRSADKLALLPVYTSHVELGRQGTPVTSASHAAYSSSRRVLYRARNPTTIIQVTRTQPHGLGRHRHSYAIMASDRPRPTTSISFASTISPQSAASPSSPNWHFPGPSSKYHQRERANTNSRNHNNVTHAVAPVLSTARRAHRRAQTSYTVPIVNANCATPNKSLTRQSSSSYHTRLASPSSSDCARSPLSRFPSYSSSTMASVVGPSTPAKASSDNQRRSMLQDSPFSDYFTDDSRSVDEPSDQSIPATETQQLLVRLNKLQSALMRGSNDSQALQIVGRRMSEIEADFESLHAQSRQPAELEDSGLFLDETEEQEPNVQRRDSDNTSVPHFGFDGTSEAFGLAIETNEAKNSLSTHREQNLLVEAQQALESLTLAQQELRKRYDELCDFHHSHLMDLEEKEEDLERLRSENEALKSDLYFDHTELLLLESQIKHLDTTIDLELDESSAHKLGNGMAALREDWSEILEKFRTRRKRYLQNGDAEDQATFNGRWSVDILRKRAKGRVSSLTLRRLDASDTEESDVKNEPTDSSSKEEVVDEPESISSPEHEYHSKLTQTSTTSSSSRHDSSDDGFFVRPFHGFASHREMDDDECAITTSPPSDAEDEPGEDDEVYGRRSHHHDPTAKTSQHSEKGTRAKSAWQELWDDMTNLAGLGEERW